MNILTILLFGLIGIQNLFENCQGNKYRSNLDRFTKIFQHQTSEIEIQFFLDSFNSENGMFQDSNKSSNVKIRETQKFTFMKLGTKEFFCNTNAKSSVHSTQNLEINENSWNEIDNKTKDYLKKTKISWLLERCFNYTIRKELNYPSQIQIDVYEICIGISIRHKRIILEQNAEVNIIEGHFNLIGDYLPNRDIFKKDGKIQQFYGSTIDKLKGNVRYTASIQFRCSYSYSGIKSVKEEKDINMEIVTIIDYESPSFCDWRTNEFINNKSINHLNSLLLPLENKCQNYTDSQFWNYELCNLYGVTQFKKENSNALKIFLLGINPNANFVLDKNINLEHYLGSNLLSNLISTQKSSQNSLFPDINVSLEPRNTNEIISENSVHDKYVIVLNLMNGTICEEINEKRSIRLVFECPDFFEKYSSNYFKIVNVVEISTCKYEMLIHTPVICSHPLLMPLPKLNKENIKCYKKSMLKEYFNFTENNYIELVSSQFDLNMIDKQEYNQFEVIKLDFIELINKKNYSYFTMSNIPRIRKNFINPKFRIGQVVKHKQLNYYAVIIGWDWNLSAPSNWSEYIYKKYPHDSKKSPHYLLLIHQQTAFLNDSPLISNKIPSNFTYTYLPEIALESIQIDSDQIFTHKKVINNPYLDLYFSHWSKTNLGFIPNSNSTLWKLYPNDFNKLIQKDEL